MTLSITIEGGFKPYAKFLVDISDFLYLLDKVKAVGFNISYRGSKVVYFVDEGRVTEENISWLIQIWS